MPGMRAEVVTPDRLVARAADRQHGAVTRAQLRAAGLSDSAIGRRVEAGQLYPVHRGVYAVGRRRLPVEGRWMAAVLACGAGAALGYRSAAALWGLAPRSGPAVGAGGPIDVVLPYGAGGRRHKGVRIHRSRSLPPGTVVRRDGIPVTNSARTIADMRRVAAPAELRSMVRKAEVLGLRTELAPRKEPTRSELEDLFLEFCERYGFPPPLGAQVFESDHERDLDLRAAGYDVVHLTWRQLTLKPDRCAEALALTAAGRARAPALRRGRRGGRDRAARRRGTSEG